MPRRSATPVLKSSVRTLSRPAAAMRPIVLAITLAMLLVTITSLPPGPASAATLSSGVFSDQDQPGAADPNDAPNTQAVTPFAGTRAPDARVANAVIAQPDPMVANVEGHPIFLSDLGDAVQSLPEQLRKMPFEVIYPMLLNRMVDHEALVLMAQRMHLDDDPKVKRQIDTATARVLEGALLERTAVPMVTDADVKARYARDFANQPVVEEVRARHILVGSEEEAKRIIAELDKGADFAALAQRFSKDPDKARGGDLGFFRHDQVWRGFADLAFSLKPGEIAQAPIFNEFGWHVVQTLERRNVPPPTLEQASEAIRKQLLQEAVTRVVAQAREGLRVHRFNINGTPLDTGTGAEDLGAPLKSDTQVPATSALPAAIPAAAPRSVSPPTASPSGSPSAGSPSAGSPSAGSPSAASPQAGSPAAQRKRGN
jgi:peptidyl-prolyl cis-trans isomerase C